MGLTKGAFLATEAASSLGLYLSKFRHVSSVFGGADARPSRLKGLVAGSSLMFGAFIAKRFVLKLDGRRIPAGDGRNHARRRPFHAMERGAVKPDGDV